MLHKFFKKLQSAIKSIELGDLERADKLLTEILLNNSANFDALYFKGLVCGMQSRHEECKKYLLRALIINSNNAFLHYNLANAMTALGESTQALFHYDQALILLPDYSKAWLNRGQCLFNLERFNDSIISFKKAIEFNPDYAEAYVNLGMLFIELDRKDEALASFASAIEINPKIPEAYNNRGNLLHTLKLFDDALTDYETAIELKPNYAEAHNNIGNSFKELRRLDEALGFYENAIHIDSNFADAHNNRGNLLIELKRFDEALASHDIAISINPDSYVLHFDRGNALNELGFFDDALISYKKSISINPDFADAHWNLSLVELLKGNFEDGWQDFEWRWKSNQSGSLRFFKQPLWLGADSLKNKTILLHAEQGVGDVVQFCRYANEVKKLGAYVILEAPIKLLGLLNTLAGIDELIDPSENHSSFDLHCPLMSLPLALKTTINRIPNVTPYLHPNLDKFKHIRREIDSAISNKNYLVGISWLSKAEKLGIDRSIELKQLITHLDLKQVQYINLQYGDCSTEIFQIEKELGISIFQSSVDNFNNIEGLAALIYACDLIVSVDNTTVHLSGSLGKDTRVLLPFKANWRWLLDRDDSPWYPTVKLYRQDFQGDWESALKKLKTDLPNFLYF